MAIHAQSPRIFKNGEEAEIIVHDDDDFAYGSIVIVVWRNENGNYLVVDPDYFHDEYDETNDADHEYDYDGDEARTIEAWKLGRTHDDIR